MNDNNDIDLSKYSGVKDKNLSGAGFGLWLLEHKRHLILAVIAVLGGASLFFYSFFFYNLFDYLRYGREQSQAINELSTINVSTSQRLAVPLETLEEKSFFHENSYDFLAKVKNPNDNFFSKISYCFVDGSEDLACSNDIIFPGQEKYLLILSKKTENKPKEIKFVIKNSAWERVDIRKYPNWKDYYNLRADFSINNIRFEKNDSVSTSGKVFSSLNFDIKNNSPYNYWDVPLQILLFNKGVVVGVNTYRISEFKSGDFKQIEITWPSFVSSVDDVKIFLNLNVLDEGNYISYK